MPLRSKRNRNPNRSNREKPETVSDIKSENPSVFFAETENQMLKNGISANRNEHQNRKNRSFWVQKPKNRSKNGQNCKTKNPMPSSLSDVTRKRSSSRVIYGKWKKGFTRHLPCSNFFFLADKDLLIENMLHRLNLFGHL